MSYTKTNWENLPSTNTPINANNLNKIENQLEILSNLQNNKVVYTSTTAGIKITFTNMPDDKIPVLILGADNFNGEIITISLFVNRNTETTTMSKYTQLSGTAKTITRNGLSYHINASIYSVYWILVPPNVSITATNEAL